MTNQLTHALPLDKEKLFLRDLVEIRKCIKGTYYCNLRFGVSLGTLLKLYEKYFKLQNGIALSLICLQDLGL